jgi:hypothetical protein
MATLNSSFNSFSLALSSSFFFCENSQHLDSEWEEHPKTHQEAAEPHKKSIYVTRLASKNSAKT